MSKAMEAIESWLGITAMCAVIALLQTFLTAVVLIIAATWGTDGDVLLMPMEGTKFLPAVGVLWPILAATNALYHKWRVHSIDAAAVQQARIEGRRENVEWLQENGFEPVRNTNGILLSVKIPKALDTAQKKPT